MSSTSVTVDHRELGASKGRSDIAERWFLQQLESLQCGRLSLRLPSGQERTFTGRLPGPCASLTVLRPSLFRRVLLGGDLAFAEAYMDGDCITNDLQSLLKLGALNEAQLETAIAGRFWQRLLARLWHCLRPNSKSGSKRNIAMHYDLGNDFYQAWLDPSMTYSAGLFEGELDDLSQAQENKFRALADLAQIKAGDRVLEIGCGWGGFAIWVAQNRQCHVTAVTISKAQHRFVAEEISRRGLEDQVSLRLEDYRQISGQFDAIVSIEMLEAVGEAYWQQYFDKIRASLKPGGRAAIQVITISDQLFAHYRKGADFIQRHVFPGGFLPSMAALQEPLSKSGLSIVEDHGYGHDYERTLEIWHERFLAAWPKLFRQGFDRRFYRLWRYYLAYCEAGFHTGRIDLRQFSLAAR